MNATIPDIAERKANLPVFLIAAGFFSVFFPALLLTSARLDAYSEVGGIGHSGGYLSCLALGCGLILLGIQRRQVHVLPAILVLGLLSYITLIVALTDPWQSPVTFLISRYGLLLWVILGATSGLTLEHLRFCHLNPAQKFTCNAIVYTTLVVVALMSFGFLTRFLNNPVVTINYQIVANSAIVLLIYIALLTEAYWGKFKPKIVFFGLIVVGTLLSFTVALLQSTAIVAFWGGLLAIIMWRSFLSLPFLKKTILVLSVVLAYFVVSQSTAFQIFLLGTRFGELSDGDGSFSSLTARFHILRSFFDQFAISPVFGNFRAEIWAQAGAGNFPHSLPLSFLSHTGSIGFIWFALVVLVLSFVRWSRGAKVSYDQLSVYILLLVLALGTISAFLTWLPFWYLVGFLCIRCTAPNYGNKK